MDILRDSQLVIFSPNAIFIAFSYKSLAGFFLQTLTKFEEANTDNTGGGVGFLRLQLTAISFTYCRLHYRPLFREMSPRSSPKSRLAGRVGLPSLISTNQEVACSNRAGSQGLINFFFKAAEKNVAGLYMYILLHL